MAEWIARTGCKERLFLPAAYRFAVDAKASLPWGSKTNCFPSGDQTGSSLVAVSKVIRERMPVPISSSHTSADRLSSTVSSSRWLSGEIFSPV